MKRFIAYGLTIVLFAACSTQEKDFQTTTLDDTVFYASFEQPGDEGTKVYANEDLLLRWTADDRVSIFNKITYNQQYKFTGETGDNAGGFRKVDSDEFVTGNTISHVVSAYPYQEATKISESEVLTFTLPAEQSYAENTFGLGANTMVSVSSDNVLQFKNVGGYLMLKLYGEGMSVSSISLRGNNGEKLAGKASITMPLDGVPSVTIASDAVEVITLTCSEPVALGATAEESTQFWFVVPPVSFSKGFTITVYGERGIYEKVTEKALSIERNKVSKMAPLEVELNQPLNVIFYTTLDGIPVYTDPDGNAVTPPDVFGAKIISNEIKDGQGVITFDGNVTSIGDRAFAECRSLSSISIPDSVMSIGDNAFFHCYNLTSITIPDGVTSIGQWAFDTCAFPDITIPDSVTSIGQWAFSSCTRLTSVTIPDGMTRIESHTFSYCYNLANVSLPNSVTSLGEGAFSQCPMLTEISMPAGVTNIGDRAFSGCTALTSINIPYGVTSIGDGVFVGCSSLTSINIPDNVTNIGNHAFENCSSLTSIIIHDNVTSIGNYAFAGCSGLTSITIPYSVTSIGQGVFSRCMSMESFKGKYASQDGLFLYDAGVLIAIAYAAIEGSVTIPDGVTRIGDGAFSGCTNLTGIAIPDSVTSIGYGAFGECSSLTNLFIPDGVTSIGPYAFSNCSELTSISIPDGVTSIEEGAFSGCSSLMSINIPDGVTSIGRGAFANCSSLTSINIPDGVTSIVDVAFAGCSGLTNIIIPESVTSIGSHAFAGCSGLTSITILAVIPPSLGSWGYDWTFEKYTQSYPIYVPAGSVDAYKLAEGWSEYADRIQAIEHEACWSLIGTLNGTSWDTDFDLTKVSGDIWAIKNVAVAASDVFKIRANHDWAISVGGPEWNDASNPGVYKPEIGKAFTTGDYIICIGVEGYYDITFDYAAQTILVEEYKDYPEHLYMIGEEFGYWDWNSDGVVEMTPVIHIPDWGANAPGQFWTVRYFHAGKGFKFCAKREWIGDFWGLGSNDGFTEAGGNCTVAEDGFYLVHVDFVNSKVHVEPARVYGIGEAFGNSWTTDMESALFTEADEKLSVTVPNEGELRMYVASTISTSPWWTREFYIIGGKITPRTDYELSAPTVSAGQKVTLDFNTGTGVIE